MKHIVHQRFKGKAICGYVNIPAMTEVYADEHIAYIDGKPLCYLFSENGMKYIARNDDGQGMTRGKLTRHIQNRLEKRDAKYQDRWNKVWEDPICRKYKRPDNQDFWLWSRTFYDAPIQDLQHIADLVDAKAGVNG